jgi:hypothetical protein
VEVERTRAESKRSIKKLKRTAHQKVDETQQPAAELPAAELPVRKGTFRGLPFRTSGPRNIAAYLGDLSQAAMEEATSEPESWEKPLKRTRYSRELSVASPCF